MNDGLKKETEKIVAYMEEHVRERITLAEISRQVGYSPSYVNKFFREITGRSPFEYLRELRMKSAADRLTADGDATILDIALDFTFDSHEGFTRAFTRAFGMPPREYRYEKGCTARPAGKRYIEEVNDDEKE